MKLSDGMFVGLGASRPFQGSQSAYFKKNSKTINLTHDFENRGASGVIHLKIWRLF